MAKRLVKRLGYRVQELRENAGLSRERLAERTGLHANTIGLIERGESNPSFLVLVALAKGLGITAADLIRPVR